jgi:hypothetical protein
VSCSARLPALFDLLIRGGEGLIVCEIAAGRNAIKEFAELLSAGSDLRAAEVKAESLFHDFVVSFPGTCGQNSNGGEQIAVDIDSRLSTPHFRHFDRKKENRQ